MSELPEAWIWTKLDTVCEKIQDGTHFSPKTQYNEPGEGRYLYITAKNIKNTGLDLSTVSYIDTETHKSIHKRCNPEKGDVLLVKDGVNTGDVTINSLEQEFSLLSSVALLKPNKSILYSCFLMYFLRSPDGFNLITGQMTGSAIKRIVLARIRQSSVCLPPLNEQRRIVAKLDSLFARSRRAREELGRVSGLCDRYKQAVLADEYEKLLAEQATLMSLGDFSLEVRNGLSRKPNDSQSGVKILRISSVRQGSVNTKDIRFYMAEPEEDITRYHLHKGDLLFTRYNGNASYVAACGMFREDTETFVYPDKLIRVRVDSRVVLTEFIEIISQTPQVREDLRDYIKTAAGQHGISGSDLKRIMFPIPPIEAQKEIVQRVEKLFNAIDLMEQEYQKASKLCDRLEQATLAKAFRGELVPQNPDDEPASALLERIRVKRQEQPKGKAVKSRQKPGEKS